MDVEAISNNIEEPKNKVSQYFNKLDGCNNNARGKTHLLMSSSTFSQMLVGFMNTRIVFTILFGFHILSPCFATQANFDLKKSLSLPCEKPCYNGVCLNGSCLCTKGWAGPQCDHCFGRVRLPENETRLSDGPLKYSSSSKCTWLLDGDNKGKVPLTLRLDSLHTECGWDFVYIYDGDGVHGPQLGAFCGDQPVQEVTALSGRATVYFFSDLAMNFDGFNISYEYNKCAYNCSNHGQCTLKGCDCEKGFTGEFCAERVCTAEDEGDPGPCKHGVCENSNCKCHSGFHGFICDSPLKLSSWGQLSVSNKRPVGRASHSSVLHDDVIWTIGGDHFEGVDMDQVIAYNITIGAWMNVTAEGKEIPKPRHDHSLVRFKNKLYMFGGIEERRNVSSELWCFDLVSKEWQLETKDNTNLTEAPLAVFGHTSHVVGSELFVFFGYNPLIGFVYQVQIYDFVTKKWRFGSSKDQVHGRFGHSSVLHTTDQGKVVLVYGGITWSSQQNNNLTDSLVQYDIKHNKWTKLPTSGVHSFHHSAVLINGLMLVIGGNTLTSQDDKKKGQCFSNSVQVYDVACKQWNTLTEGIPDELKRFGHTVVTDGNSVFLFGGFNGRLLNDVWRFDPADCGSFTRLEDCRTVVDGVKCLFTDRTCKKVDPLISYKPSFLSFVKGQSNKGTLECRYTDKRQALQVCEEHTDCVACASEAGCGWCSAGEQCLPSEGDCVDWQVMVSTWEKCSKASVISQRPCSMAEDCLNCHLLNHCVWYEIEHKPSCITRAEHELVVAEERERLRELERASASLRPRLNLLAHTHTNNTQCPLSCAQLSSCVDCVRNQRCLWCPTTERCLNMESYTLSFAYGQCHSWVTASSPGGPKRACQIESSRCIDHKTCQECQRSPACGWLDDGLAEDVFSSETGVGNCLEGSAHGPLDLSVLDDLSSNDTDLISMVSGAEINEQWFFTDCPACQCNGHSKCTKSLVSFGSATKQLCGICDHNTQGLHCETCADGYFGDPRNGGNCSVCECNGQADSCSPYTGNCNCRTKGVVGTQCDRCDSKYYGTPEKGSPCYYELAVDFIFTFKLKNDDKDRYVSDIYLFSVPYKRDTDVTFQISCSSNALVALNLTSSNYSAYSSPLGGTRRMMHNTTCDEKGFRRVYVASDPNYAYGTGSNTTFFVRIYNFTTPITIQVSFAQSPPINWVLFFVIFAACFIVLLVVAGLLWMVKLRVEVYRRNQRRIDEIEHMASRPFANVKLSIGGPAYAIVQQVPSPTPLSVEPCANNKAGVFTLAVRLPTGGRAATPSGTSGLAVASALCQLTPALLAVLQAPESPERKNNQKTNLRRYIPFLRQREEQS